MAIHPILSIANFSSRSKSPDHRSAITAQLPVLSYRCSAPLELEKYGRSTMPSRSIPAEMRIAGLLGPSSRFTECRASIALEGHGGADEIAGHGGQLPPLSHHCSATTAQLPPF